MKVAVLDDYQHAFSSLPCAARLAGHDLRLLHTHCDDPDRLAAALGDAEAVIATMQRTAFPAELIARLPALRLISQTGRNTGHIDVAACSEAGVLVCAGGSGDPGSIAELTWGLILSALRHIPEEAAGLRQGGWQTTVGERVAGKTLGLYAYGRIGSRVAKIGAAMGAHVLCWGREGSTAAARADGFAVAESRESFFASADIVSLHITLNAATRGIVTAPDLARMKPDALLVNTSRAGIIAPGALADALRRGRPGRAALDVFDREPASPEHEPLLRLPNVLATPHLGYVDRETYGTIFSVAVDQVLAFAAGQPINALNAPAARRVDPAAQV
ncbi:MAG: D-2-hydroxyacid dehydrogenase family protein [Acetobacteraceae bacterium]|nr:D-2-hydroxyacid dehydrogenase family protein [Acetobacteraceae bacterium]